MYKRLLGPCGWPDGGELTEAWKHFVKRLGEIEHAVTVAQGAAEGNAERIMCRLCSWAFIANASHPEFFFFFLKALLFSWVL